MDKHHLIRIYLQRIIPSQREEMKLRLLMMSPNELRAFRRAYCMKHVHPKRPRIRGRRPVNQRSPALQMSDGEAFRQPTK